MGHAVLTALVLTLSSYVALPAGLLQVPPESSSLHTAGLVWGTS